MIFIYVGVAQRGTTSEIAPYHPMIDTLVFPDETSSEKICDSAQEHIELIAKAMGWGDSYYSFVTREVLTSRLAYFADDVLKWERERTGKYPEYQIVCYVSLKDRPSPAMIRGKVFRNFQECLKSVTELNEMARQNGLEVMYHVHRKND